MGVAHGDSPKLALFETAFVANEDMNILSEEININSSTKKHITKMCTVRALIHDVYPYPLAIDKLAVITRTIMGVDVCLPSWWTRSKRVRR